MNDIEIHFMRRDVVIDTHPIRERLNADVAAFLARGGSISRVAPGESAVRLQLRQVAKGATGNKTNVWVEMPADSAATFRDKLGRVTTGISLRRRARRGGLASRRA